MKRRMKMGLALALSAAMLFSVAGCGSSDSGKSGSDTIRVAIWDNNQLAGLQEIASEWSKESGQQVEFQVLDWSSYWTMLEAGVSGGEMPDVFWMHSNYATKYMESDVVVLAQASMAPAKESVERVKDWVVLTSPESCIEEVKAFYGKN